MQCLSTFSLLVTVLLQTLPFWYSFNSLLCYLVLNAESFLELETFDCLVRMNKILLNLANWSFFVAAVSCCEHFAIDPACIDHYSRAVSEWTKGNTVSFGLRDMIRHFRDRLGR